MSASGVVAVEPSEGVESGLALGHPALPEQIRIPTTSPAKHATPREHVSWRPELNWAYDARLTASRTEDLLACNRWFQDTNNQPARRVPVPLRERSYEIFRYEKRLDTLITGALFAPGRLTLEQLATYREPPPLAHRRLGDGNLDAEGIAIPARASINGAQHGLPPIEPATALYRLLLAHKPTAGDATANERARILTAWLPEELRQGAHALLTKGQRLAQEATNRNELSVEPNWRW